MQHDLNAPALGRYCRLQILAFLVLNLLGSCVHVSPGRSALHEVKPVQSDLQALTPAQAVSKTAVVTSVTP